MTTSGGVSNGRPFESDVAGIAALSDPVRLEIYRYVAAQDGAVGRDEVSGALGLPRSVAASHLDRLADAGLFDIEFRRLSGRQGPGAGRPAKLYRRASRDIGVSLPPRDYELPARLLAQSVVTAQATGQPIDAALAEIARAHGIALGAEARRQAGSGDANQLIRAVMDVLARYGYEPRRVGDEIVLTNCPFHALAARFTDLVCGMNLELVEGAVAGAGSRLAESRLEPRAETCCVRLRLNPPA
jgi:predicted ArsR family transcriptional regulator